MAFTLNDTQLQLEADRFPVDGNEVKNILFESALNLVDIDDDIRMSTAPRTSIALPTGRLTDLEQIEEEEETDDDIKNEIEFDDEESDEEIEDQLLEESMQSSNLKVFLRIRTCDDPSPFYQFDKQDNCVLWIQKKLKGTKNGRNRSSTQLKRFKFNHIFDPNTSEQWPIFESSALPLLSDFLCGDNSLLFTYGITSSGKSYTMRGTADQPGIIPHSLAMLFGALKCTRMLDSNEFVHKFKTDKFNNLRNIENEEELLQDDEYRSKIVNHITESEVSKDLFIENISKNCLF